MQKVKYVYFDIFRVFLYFYNHTGYKPHTGVHLIRRGIYKSFISGKQQYRNKFEGAELQLCSHLKDRQNLKKVLLYSAGVNKNSDKKVLTL